MPALNDAPPTYLLALSNKYLGKEAALINFEGRVIDSAKEDAMERALEALSQSTIGKATLMFEFID